MRHSSQKEFADVWNRWRADGGTSIGLSRHLGVHIRALYNRRSRVERALGIKLETMVGNPIAAKRVAAKQIMDALRGDAPEYDMVHPVAPGFMVKGTSTLYKPDGSVAQQWVKSTQDSAAREALLKEAGEAFASEIPRAEPAMRPTRHTQDDLLNAYIISDYHIGMLAWGEETGADWDTTIAENTLVGWFNAAIESAPAASNAIFAQLGDLLHYDGLESVTPTGGHQLDADTRFQKLVRVTIRVLRRVIALLLAKHEHVHVVMAEGNHDIASSVWLREWFSALYDNEPRITVDRSPDPYYCYEHGKTALFFHHGHLKKMGAVDSVFAGKFREVFGRTKFNYAHTGHLHHVELKETNLMLVEQHRTLAAPDAYASRHGWMSGRDAQVITYSKKHGEVGRVRISANMVQERAA